MKLRDAKLRSSCPEVFYKKDVLRNFAKFAGKHQCQTLIFNKVAGLRTATLLKKTLWHRCFLVNFSKFLRTPFLQNTSSFWIYFQNWLYDKILHKTHITTIVRAGMQNNLHLQADSITDCPLLGIRISGLS